jgi:hypothetical protein
MVVVVVVVVVVFMLNERVAGTLVRVCVFVLQTRDVTFTLSPASYLETNSFVDFYSWQVVMTQESTISTCLA